MAEPVRLREVKAAVDRRKVGISYSSVGLEGAAELGCALAFIRRGIVPDVICGVGTGAIVAAAHAVDSVDGRGIDIVKRSISQTSLLEVEVGWETFGRRIMEQGTRIASLGDHRAVINRIVGSLEEEFGAEQLPNPAVEAARGQIRRRRMTVGMTGGQTGPPKLLLGATSLRDGTSVWFPDEILLSEALAASTAVPAALPWVRLSLSGSPIALVSGAAVWGQSLSNLVLEGCGTIFSCSLGAPILADDDATAVSVGLWATTMAKHQAVKLEAAFAECRMGGQGIVHHIHPVVDLRPTFTAPVGDGIDQLVEESATRTAERLAELNA